MEARTYCNINEAAALLSCNRASVRRWVREGRLEGEQVGRSVVIRLSDVERLREERACEHHQHDTPPTVKARA